MDVLPDAALLNILEFCTFEECSVLEKCFKSQVFAYYLRIKKGGFPVCNFAQLTYLLSLTDVQKVEKVIELGDHPEIVQECFLVPDGRKIWLKPLEP